MGKAGESGTQLRSIAYIVSIVMTLLTIAWAASKHVALMKGVCEHQKAMTIQVEANRAHATENDKRIIRLESAVPDMREDIGEIKSSVRDIQQMLTGP